jgi:hypothetical protein
LYPLKNENLVHIKLGIAMQIRQKNHSQFGDLAFGLLHLPDRKAVTYPNPGAIGEVDDDRCRVSCSNNDPDRDGHSNRDRTRYPNSDAQTVTHPRSDKRLRRIDDRRLPQGSGRIRFVEEEFKNPGSL